MGGVLLYGDGVLLCLYWVGGCWFLYVVYLLSGGGVLRCCSWSLCVLLLLLPSLWLLLLLLSSLYLLLLLSSLLSLFPWSLCVGRLLSFLSVCVAVMLMVLFSVVVGSWWWYLHVSPNLQFPLWWYLQLILWSLLCFSFHSLVSWSILLRVLVMVFRALVAFSCFPVIMMVALFSSSWCVILMVTWFWSSICCFFAPFFPITCPMRSPLVVITSIWSSFSVFSSLLVVSVQSSGICDCFVYWI